MGVAHWELRGGCVPPTMDQGTPPCPFCLHYRDITQQGWHIPPWHCMAAPLTPFPVFPRRGPAAADGEPGDALQGGAAAAAAAAEAAAAEGAAGRQGSVPLGAQPQGRPHQQQQQRLQRGQPGPGLRGLGLEAGGQGRDEIRVCRSIESRGTVPGGPARRPRCGEAVLVSRAGAPRVLLSPATTRLGLTCVAGGDPHPSAQLGLGQRGGAAGAAPSLLPPQLGAEPPGTWGGLGCIEAAALL